MKGPKRYPPPESRAASKHVLVYPNWMSAQRYHEYQESRASAARAAHDKMLKSTVFPFPKRKSDCIEYLFSKRFYCPKAQEGQHG